MWRLSLSLVLIGLLFWVPAGPAFAEVKAEKKAPAQAEEGGGEGGSEGGGESGGGEAEGGGGGGVVHDGSKGSYADGVYLTIAPIIISVFNKKGKVGKLSAVFTLELESEEAVAAAAKKHTKLRDALIRELQRLSQRESRRGREYSVGQIKGRVKVIVAKQLGEDVVKDVLVQALTRS